MMTKAKNNRPHSAALLIASAAIMTALGASAFAQSDQIADSKTARAQQPVAAVKPAETCLLVRAIRDHRVPEAGQLEFRVRANSYVKVHFRDECKALTERSQISYRSVSSKLCRGDEVRILASLGSSANVTGICYIKGFDRPAKDENEQ